MENPWAELPTQPPYVAPVDARLVARYRADASRLRLDFLPSPYIGTPRATVLVLMLYPSARNDDFAFGDHFVAERRRALRFDGEWPFWPLNPAFQHTPGSEYATTRMRTLIEDV